MPDFTIFHSIIEKIKPNSNNTENQEKSMKEETAKDLIEIAECYLFGRGDTKKDEEKAVEYLRKAAYEIQDEDSLQAQVSIIKLK